MTGTKPKFCQFVFKTFSFKQFLDIISLVETEMFVREAIESRFQQTSNVRFKLTNS